ncbi:MAG: signal recognition particle-docking protein FtsY [Bacilli bacterium]
MGFFSKIKNIFNKQEYIKEKINDEEIDNGESLNEIEEVKETEKYVEGLSKSRDNFVSKLSLLGIKYTKISDDFYDELEEILITADIGVNTVMDFVDRLKKRVKSENITDFEYLKEVIVDELFMIYVGDDILSSKLNLKDGETNVVLFVGVNGVGKTTSIAKIANKFKSEGKKIMLIAGDTFRAGAVNQLNEWASRIGVSFYGDDRKDPSAVIYDGLTRAKNEKYDLVLVDTAGRLQNKVNLMKELEKMNRVINEILPGNPVETLLVIDATTGQNGIAQARSFKEITNITGIVLTKLDGTAKGGIVLAIKELVNIPVKFVGLGEKETDLIPFDIEKYIYGLFKEF